MYQANIRWSEAVAFYFSHLLYFESNITLHSLACATIIIIGRNIKSDMILQNKGFVDDKIGTCFSHGNLGGLPSGWFLVGKVLHFMPLFDYDNGVHVQLCSILKKIFETCFYLFTLPKFARILTLKYHVWNEI